MYHSRTENADDVPMVTTMASCEPAKQTDEAARERRRQRPARDEAVRRVRERPRERAEEKGLAPRRIRPVLNVLALGPALAARPPRNPQCSAPASSSWPSSARPAPCSSRAAPTSRPRWPRSRPRTSRSTTASPARSGPRGGVIGDGGAARSNATQRVERAM